jgi:dCTP deaminase
MNAESGASRPRVSVGVLPYQQLETAIRDGWITASVDIQGAQIQPASLDLRLGRLAYQLRSSFLPFKSSVSRRLQQADFGFRETDLVIDRLALHEGATLQRGNIYLVELLETLALPPDVRGRCNPKSTTGRLDIFTRLIADDSSRFDEIEPGYRGPLFLEIAPQSFPVRVRTGLSLNQLRLLSGRPQLSEPALRALYGREPLLYAGSEPVPETSVAFKEGLGMGVDLSGEDTDGVIGYRAHTNPPVVDLSRVGHYDPEEFWEPIKRPGRDSYILDANRFYILVSRERIRVPPEYAAEMVVYDAGAGEIRTHYAGFFDPGFGFGDGSIRGTKVVMEVRAREVPFMVYHGQTLFKVGFEHLTEPPERVYGREIGSSYQGQSLTLSKQFRRG